MVLGQQKAVLVGTWWCWVSIGQYRLIYDVNDQHDAELVDT